VAITLAYGIFIFVNAWQFNRKFARMREEEKARHPQAFAKAGEPSPGQMKG